MSMAIKYAMKKKMAKTNLAEGGEVGDEKHRRDNERGVHKSLSPESHQEYMARLGHHERGTSQAGLHARAASDTSRSHSEREYNREQAKAIHGSVVRKMADGGMVDRIMAKRGDGEEPTADFESNDFDKMDSHPAPHDADYTGANSGDELGNGEMDENDQDLISRIMRSRAKKDRMPRPA